MAKTIISIAGTTAHAGVSSLALSYATFLRSAYSLSVCIINLSHSDYIYMQDKKCSLIEDGFLLKRIAVYPYGDSNTITRLMHSDYDAIILDIGNELTKYQDDFLRSDIRIVVMELSDFKKHSSYAFYSLYEPFLTGQHIAYYYQHGTKHTVKHMSSLLGQKLKRIPYEEDPTKISNCNFIFYQNIFKPWHHK